MYKFSFFALVPELKKESGHYFQYHQQVEKVVECLGGKFTAYVNEKCTIASMGSTWKKWFRRKKDPKCSLRHLFKLSSDFAKVFREPEEGTKRIFFLESFTSGDLFSFVVASLFFKKPKDQLWVLFRFERGKREMFFQSFLMRIAKQFLKDQWFLLCDSELMLPKLEKMFKQKMELLPHYLSTFSEGEELEPQEKIICSWLGAPRIEKGLKRIQKLAYLKDPLSEKFTLSVSEATKLNCKNELTILYAKDNLDRKSYEDEFIKSDVILLPYESSSYRYRTSGIFIETILGGKIPIVTENTWSAFKLREFGLEELIVDWNDPLFFSSLYALLQKNEIKAGLALMKKAYEQNHSFSSFKAKIASLLS